MKHEDVRIKNEEDAHGDSDAKSGAKPEHGADSQLHNYNVALTRLGDLFGDDDEASPPPAKQP